MTAELYNSYLYDRIQDLIKSKPETEWTNNDLSKMFEYYVCILLSEQKGTPFYEYDTIPADFKEENYMSRTDTGVDCCDLISTIVQCKLRKNNLSYTDCATFFASQVSFSDELQEQVLRWKNLIIAMNTGTSMSRNLETLLNQKRFLPFQVEKEQMIRYCKSLPKPEFPPPPDFELRDYQKEAIKVIHDNQNSIICLPTGCGKNAVITMSMKPGKKYLILVPRVVLEEQLKEYILKLRPEWKHKIQLIDSDRSKELKGDIIICIYNSIREDFPFGEFERIYIDEAHHIYTPELYQDGIDDEFDEEESDADADADVEISDEDKKDTYMSIIRGLTKYHNNVYLSATIDEKEGFVYYKKDIRDMIEAGWISDYVIHIPIFSSKATDTTVCNHLIHNYRSIIIYCANQNEGKALNDLMNSIRPGCSDYVDCDTSKTKRRDIFKKFNDNELPFIVNVRILIEGFDSPITKGVCFFHMTKSHVNQVQIIGRALRKHLDKLMANIIIPFAKADDERAINEFMKVMANNDRRIRQSISEKRVGGYLSIEKGQEDEKADEEELSESNHRYTLIFDKLGRCRNKDEVFFDRLTGVKGYILNNKQRPARESKNKEIAAQGKWIELMNKHFANRTGLMQDDKIYNAWFDFITDNNFRKHFISLEGKWIHHCMTASLYLAVHRKKPPSTSEDVHEQFILTWMNTQKYCLKKDKSSVYKNEKINKLWKQFCSDKRWYVEFMTDIDYWHYNHDRFVSYLDEGKKPGKGLDSSKEENYLCKWFQLQMICFRSGKMISPEIYEKFKLLINNPKYIFVLVTKEDIWMNKYALSDEFLDKNKRRPCVGNEGEEELSHWLTKLVTFDRTPEENLSEEMKKRKGLARQLIEKYADIFGVNKADFDSRYSQLDEFLTKKEYSPKNTKKQKGVKENPKDLIAPHLNELESSLNRWIKTQNANYKNKSGSMETPERRKLWDDLKNKHINIKF